MTVDELLRLPEDRFRELVDEEVREIREQGDPPSALANLLRDPKVIERWYVALTAMKKSVENQIGGKRSDLEKLRVAMKPDTFRRKIAEYHKWKSGAMRFKAGVEDRLSEIRSIRAIAWPTESIVKEERNQALALAMYLKTAIEQHRRRVLAEYDASDADLALWKTLDGSPVPAPALAAFDGASKDGHSDGDGHKQSVKI